MRRNEKQIPHGETDRLARAIAQKIMRWQTLLAASLNERIGRFSIKAQRWLMTSFCLIPFIGLIICLTRAPANSRSMMKEDGYLPLHIGQPSVPPGPTDTLTLKK